MLQVKVGEKVEEYRAKWAPSTEVEVQGHVWEVSSVKKMHMIRPRFGKTPVSAAVADATIRSRLQGEFLFPFFLEAPMVDNSTLLISSSVSTGQVVGVKAIIFHCSVGQPLQLVLIRDEGKPLDCLGGHVEVGETPEGAMIREAREETRKAVNPLQLNSRQLVYHGMTPSGEYISHVFSYLMMEDPTVYPGMEVVEMDDIPAWVNSQRGYPRQSWLARHLLFLSTNYGNLETALAAHLMAVKQVPLGSPALLSFCFSPRVLRKRLQRFESLYQMKMMEMIKEREKMGFSPEVAVKKLSFEWPAPGFTFKDDLGNTDVVKPQELFNLMECETDIPMEQERDPPSSPTEIRALVALIFSHFKSSFVSTYDFNTQLARLGFRKGVKSARKFARKLKEERYVKEVANSFLKGGRGYEQGVAMT